MRGIVFLLCILAFLASSSCVFGPGKYKGVIGYRSDGRVFLTHDTFYRVGKLSGDWLPMKSRARAISFYNSTYKSSITTDAFCGRLSGDLKLSSLGGEIISALEKRKRIFSREIILDGRSAIRERVEGELDGAAVVVDLVVVRKDACAFDFYAVMPPNADDGVTRDFESFFEGFGYYKK